MTVNEIQKKLLTNVSDNFDKSVGGFVYDILKAAAIQFQESNEKNNTVLQKMDIENLTSDELTRFVYQRTGLSRRLATYAETIVKLTGKTGSVIEAGSLVAAGEIFYEFTESTTIDETGIAFVNVACQQSGVVGNVPANQIVSFPVTLSGIVSVTNEEAVTTGYEEEADNSLKERYYEKLQKPGKAGNEFHYLEWAKSVTGVGKVKVFPKWEGPLTVRVSILDENIGKAQENLIKNVEEYIETQRPFGAIVTVTTGIELPLNISAELTLEQNFTLEDVKENLTDRISEYLKTLSYVSEYVSYAQIGKEILNVQGVIDYQNLTLNGSTVNVQLSEESIPIVGDVVWT